MKIRTCIEGVEYMRMMTGDRYNESCITSNLIIVHCIEYYYNKETSVIVIGGECNTQERLQNRNKNCNCDKLTKVEYAEI
jgi:hypothetical protein